MVSAISDPLVSWILECQSGSWALKSPRTRESPAGRKSWILGLKPVVQLVVVGMYILMMLVSPTRIPSDSVWPSNGKSGSIWNCNVLCM